MDTITNTNYFPTMAQLNRLEKFPEEWACLEVIRLNRYGSDCPQCRSAMYKLTTRQKVYACALGHHMYPLAGTIFNKSKTPLNVWFGIIRDLQFSRGLLPANEIMRKYKLSYKTAWRLKDIVCKHLELDKGYSYRYSSVKNGRHYQLARRRAVV